ncbi:MAG TPA: sigma-70 family RNA polymerase sigma factor [Gaiellaceae bacterium]
MTPLLAQRPRSDRAFERMYKRHVGDVYRYALAVMRNPADAEDVTQTTFLNAYRAFVEKGDRPEKPQNWLIAIAHNVCRQRFRQSARRPSEVAFEDDIADTLVDEESPSGEDIRRALGQLAFNQRAALVMRELEGRSYAEIAEILDVSISAVETLIFRARRALREQLEGSLTCGQAEFAISRQLDGRLPRSERAQLRAHLRECPDCAAFARRQRAQRGALKSLALVPVPGSLSSFFGGGSAVGTGLALKAIAAVTAGVVVGGASVATVEQKPWKRQAKAAPSPPVFRSVSPQASVPAPREHIPVLGSRARAQQVRHVARPRAKAKSIAVRHGGALGRQKHSSARSSHAGTHVAYRPHPAHPVHPTVHWRPHVSTPKLHVRPHPQPAPHGNGNGSGGSGGNGKSH